MGGGVAQKQSSSWVVEQMAIGSKCEETRGKKGGRRVQAELSGGEEATSGSEGWWPWGSNVVWGGRRLWACALAGRRERLLSRYEQAVE